MARPVTYTPDIIAQHLDAVVLWIADGKTLRDYCRQDGAPSVSQVYRWIDADVSVLGRIAQAREDGADCIAMDCLTIADTPLFGEERTIKPGGSVEVKQVDMLAHRKLQIETRLKLLAKWNPRKYGDRVGVDHSGSIDGPPTLNLILTTSADRTMQSVGSGAIEVGPSGGDDDLDNDGYE